MRLLIIGGTGFVGRHIAAAAIERGHDVTLFNRGRTDPQAFPSASSLCGDRDRDLSALAAARWDATIDANAYTPTQIHRLADALGDRGGRYALISSVAVYADPASRGGPAAPLKRLDRSAVDGPVDERNYGGLKVLCEEAAAQRFGEPLIIRPTYVIGPGDVTLRFPWWVARIARGGDVAAPGRPERAVQLIDARDLATWTLTLVERGDHGALDGVATAPPFGFRDMLAAVAATLAPPATSFIWIDTQVLQTTGMPPSRFPLWTGGVPVPSTMHIDPSPSRARGLEPRPLADSIADVHTWLRATSPRLPSGVGLAPAEEAALLAAAAARGPRP
jgi:2'-hydroxyisoflavone reductase